MLLVMNCKNKSKQYAGDWLPKEEEFQLNTNPCELHGNFQIQSSSLIGIRPALDVTI